MSRQHGVKSRAAARREKRRMGEGNLFSLGVGECGRELVGIGGPNVE